MSYVIPVSKTLYYFDNFFLEIKLIMNLFTDENLDPIELKSSWKKERSLDEQSTQTKELATEDKASQSIKRRNKEVQSDAEKQYDIPVLNEDSPELAAWLLKMEPLVYKELQKNHRSHAFDGYALASQDESDTVTIQHTLTNAELKEQLQVTSLSWNSTGAVIVAAFGRFDHEDWCTHKSTLCTWNLDKRNLDANKSDTVIDLQSCLMTVQCHPNKPSVIAGGTFNGEVLVWDLSKEDDPLIATSGIGDDSHREPVSRVQWQLDETKQGRYNIVSASSDGKMLVWQLSSKKTQLKLVDGFILLAESLPRHLRAKSRGNKEVGVTCLSFNSQDSTAFVVGSETGGIFRCSTRNKGSPPNRNVISSVPLHSPVTFTFDPHNGPVYSLESSPFHRNVMLSCGTDTSARLYSMLQGQPIVTIEPGVGYLYSAKWSPVRPMVFAVTSEDGSLLIYDLKHSHGVPKHKLDGSMKKQPVYTMQFNKHNNLLATGDGLGYIRVWKLTDELTNAVPNELECLDEIASKVLE